MARFCVIASALFIALGAAACDGNKSGDRPGATTPVSAGGLDGADQFVAGQKADVFTSVIASDPETFDPAKMSGQVEGNIAMNIFEGLLMPGPTTDESKLGEMGLVVPGVASGFEVSDDGKTYTFAIRPEAKWSSGESIRPEDFVYSWKRVLTPETGADYATSFYVIKGAEAFHKGEGSWDEVGVRAEGDKLVVELENPTPYFPELVAFYTFYPVPKAAIEEHGDAWTKPENIVTNGPYRLATYTPQQEIVLERSENYWDKGNVALERVRLRVINDLNAIVNAYKTGELHYTGSTQLPVAQLADLIMHPDYVTEPYLGTYYYRINVSKEGPLKDPRVRRALSMATDRDQIVKQALKGIHKVADSYVPPEMPGYESTAKTKTNPAGAKKLLAEAGYGKDNPLKIKLLYNTDENHKLVAEAIQEMWRSNLGIEVELVNKEWKTYLQDIDTLQYEVARAGWIGDYNDPMTFLDMWTSGNGNNDTGWSDAEYDRLIASASAEADVAKRTEMLQKAEAILLERGPIIPIYFYTNNKLASRFLKGIESHNRDIHLFKYVSMPERT